MSPHRVLMVEDDAALQRFAALALEDLPIELLLCGNAAQALAVLSAGPPVRLLLTDLMLPGESGQALLERLRANPALAGDARLAVCSAGVNPAVRTTLETLGVWRILSKPVSVLELRQCVEDALEDTPGGALPARPGESAAPALPASDIAQAIERYFAGNLPLFEAYRSSCQRQFPADLRAAAQAIAQQDLPGLGRLAHSLKTVLLSLGDSAAGAAAREVEAAANRGSWPDALRHWPAVQSALQVAGA